MNKILNLFLLMSVMLSACKVSQVMQRYQAATSSSYTIYNKTFSFNTITVEGKFVNAYSDSSVFEGKTGVGNVICVFHKKPVANRTYLVDSIVPIKNSWHIALRYDFVVNNKPPIISVFATPKKGETATVSEKDGKLVIASKGVTMEDGSVLSFNMVQQ